MQYLLLMLAVLSEVTGTSLLKATEGFTRLWPTVACLSAYGLAFLALSRAVQRGLDVGIGYAIWAGLGTTLIVAIGAVFLHERLTAAKLLGVALIIAGVIVVNLAGGH
ncbi:small multidrug resistance pump [Frankia sp. EI5c]|uniref:DMT family transporter n=1 Tax=Frankia sp. EI5c TaxID=683316 RepID=UPI0007C396D7|nr:multidrug efflux SMR transporter [Frankia sp. EI5c]OAA29662.1 small multidrug resistance pump [Frankia sp. EI5c]